METAISIQNLSKRFGGAVAVNDVALDLEPDGKFRLIGPNGSGKSTLFNLIVGAHRPTAGVVRIHGQTVSGLATHRVAKIGAVRTRPRGRGRPGTPRRRGLRAACSARPGRCRAGCCPPPRHR
jgi:branched-chain amino acid transport system ATP-binding protein